MTRRSVTLNQKVPEGFVEINPKTAKKYGIIDGDLVKVSSRRGNIKIKAFVTDVVADGSVFIPFHFAEAAANVLTNPALDPIAKIPEFKVCAVCIKKV